ncbi:helix-turn-helix domain-containing protein [Kitasatospora acidiphila]|uniref:helix-turn-helix domain-containing protein n=1 Tax=Kitasatospora acidiphila TaxID=2567942 RepID=UPI003C7514E8
MARKKFLVPQSVYRRQLSSRLSELRDLDGRTLAEVAQVIEIGQGSLSRIENGDRGTTPIVVRALLDCYGISDTQAREELLDLVRADQAQRQPWWRKHSAVINTTQYGGYLALEDSAISVRTYGAMLVPGLLQTREYAHLVITEMRPDLTERQVVELVEVRMRRQQERVAKGLKMWAVIDEAALARLSGSPDILGGQLEHLLAIKPPMNVTVQLLPFPAGIHPGQYGSFIHMEFAEPNPDVVWVESLTNSVCFEDEGDVDRYAEAFDHLRARALGPPQSRTRLRSMLKEL